MEIKDSRLYKNEVIPQLDVEEEFAIKKKTIDEWKESNPSLDFKQKAFQIPIIPKSKKPQKLSEAERRDHLARLKKGDLFTLYNEKGIAIPKIRVFADENLENILYKKEEEEEKILGSIPISEITDIVRGHKTKVFVQYGNCKYKFFFTKYFLVDNERLGLSIVSPNITLDLEAKSQTERDMWIISFRTALESKQNKSIYS